MEKLNKQMNELACNRGHVIADRYIKGEKALVILATTKPCIKLTKAQARLVNELKNLYCLEGDTITLEQFTTYMRQDLIGYQDLLIQTMSRYFKVNATLNIRTLL